jgi:DNA polymerase III gamma/tau subunit
MEERYSPRSFDELISPSREIVIQQLKACKKANQSILCMGSINTFKREMLKQYVSHFSQMYEINVFNDLSSQMDLTDLKTFCKTVSSKSKVVLIEHFDMLSEIIQSYLKILMEEFPHVVFALGAESTKKIIESIQTRTTPIYFEEWTTMEYRQLVDRILQQEGMVIHSLDALFSLPSLSIYFIFNLFHKLRILQVTELDHLTPYLHLHDPRQLDLFFDCIGKEDLKAAVQVLFLEYEKGYSLLDIYHFLYEYLKVSKKWKGLNYLYIEKLCSYIQQIYEGNDHKLMLLYLANEFLCIFKNNP